MRGRSPDALVATDERLDALSRFSILDTLPEPGFDDIVALATQLCEVPVALVSLVDGDRQWFKARKGFEPHETDLDRSVCRHALGRTEILEIEDLSLDPRTASNPLVTDAPHMRFYAGAPLTTRDDQTLGTLCVIDHSPRPGGLSAAQRAGLRSLANQVMAQLELRRAVVERDEAIEARRHEQRSALVEAARLEAMIATQEAVAAAGADLKIVFRAIVEGALRIVDTADGAVIELREGEEIVYDVAAGSSAAHVGVRMPVDRTLSGRAVSEGKPLLCNDTEADRTIDPTLARELSIRSAIIVPVARHGVPIGALKLQASRPGAFTPRDLVMAQMLAGLVASSFDEDARSNEAQREAETRYRQTFESVTEFGIIVMDRDGTITEWNTGAEDIFGWGAGEMRGSDASRFYTPEDREIDRSRTEMRQALEDGVAVDERWHLRRDGSRFYASGNVMPLRGDDGEHLGFIKIVRDRTEQHIDGQRLKQSRMDLAASEAKWRSLFETLQEGFLLGKVVRDADGKVVDWTYEEVNKAWSDLLGIPADQTVGRTVRELIPGVEDIWVSEIARVVETRDAIRFTRQVGSIGRWYDGVCQPAGDDRFTVIFLDVTERVLAERRRDATRELNDRLRESRDIATVSARASEIIGETLGASRAGFGVIDPDRETVVIEPDWCRPGMTSVAGHHNFRHFGSFIEDLKRGRRVVIRDTTADPRTAGEGAAALESIGIRTLVNLPILTRGRLSGVALVHYDRAHDWSDADTAFLRDAADRTGQAIARIQAEERRELLNAELAHRLKNNLALVQSIVTQTLRGASDIASARTTLAQRIQALAKAHDLLVVGRRDAALVQDIVGSAIAMHDEANRIRLEGPDLVLGPKAALALVLICHELATNAAKYGPLSGETGHVDVGWRVDEAASGALFVFEWREIGGPAVSPPTRRSFGTRLIEIGLSGAMGSKSEIDYDPAGLRCRVTGPLVDLQTLDEDVENGGQTYN